MTKTYKTKRDARRARQIKQKFIGRVITIGSILIFIVAVIWIAISSNKSQANAGQSAAQTSPNSPTQGGATPQLVGTKQYSAAPPFLIDVTKQYSATVKMQNGGEFEIQLFPDKAPLTVNSFVFLARQGYFDGVSFHRVLEGFMAQGGDPSGTGSGGPGYYFGNEINDLTFDKAGVVAMANTGLPNSNGSQFFIMFGPYGLSESDYTIFGQVTSGMEIVNTITRRDPDKNPSFTGDVILSITISEK